MTAMLPGAGPAGAWVRMRRAAAGSARLLKVRQAVAMAGFEAGFDAGAGAQVIDQPKARRDQNNDDNGGGKVLQGAPVFVFILQPAQRIDDFSAALAGFCLARELDDFGPLSQRRGAVGRASCRG